MHPVCSSGSVRLPSDTLPARPLARYHPLHSLVVLLNKHPPSPRASVFPPERLCHLPRRLPTHGQSRLPSSPRAFQRPDAAALQPPPCPHHHPSSRHPRVVGTPLPRAPHSGRRPPACAQGRRAPHATPATRAATAMRERAVYGADSPHRSAALARPAPGGLRSVRVTPLAQKPVQAVGPPLWPFPLSILPPACAHWRHAPHATPATRAATAIASGRCMGQIAPTAPPRRLDWRLAGWCRCVSCLSR
jgi:hypothetical protein